MRTETCILTYSGREVDLLSPRPTDISLLDIAEGLSKLCRYNGHVQSFYSQAQHNCIVSDYLAHDVKPYGLFYDAHQAYLGHLIKPVRTALHIKNSQDAIEDLSLLMQETIHHAFGLKFPPHEKVVRIVRQKKEMISLSEKRDLIPDYELSEHERNRVLAHMIHPWSWFKSHEIFLEKCREIGVRKPEILKHF